MKWLGLISYLFFVFLFATCNYAAKKNTSYDAEDGEMILSLDTLYDLMETIALPFSSEKPEFWNVTGSVPLPANLYSSFYDLSTAGEDARMLKLPAANGFQVVMVYYMDGQQNGVADLYTFTEQMDRKDFLRIYSTEELGEEDQLAIQQTFRIENDYRIQTSKHLSGLLIEQLYYRLTKEGIFEEIRDGETPAVTYEMYNGIEEFVVESFIWEYDSTGKLIKKRPGGNCI
ncbi:MAG: hypothetical protein LUG51_07710 [Tannerellaceae bacterium]|nr:hypothetical protein [Tannerellaceae bacterium]